MKNELFRVGIITATHALKGEVRVFPTTDDPDRFRDLDMVLWQGKNGTRELKIVHAHRHRQFVLLKFAGIDSIEEAEPYVRGELFVRREDALSLQENEYYVADLIGLKVVREDGTKVGAVSEVLPTGANDVYVVRTEDGGEILLPAIRQCILRVDIDAGVMTVRILPGLLEEQGG